MIKRNFILNFIKLQNHKQQQIPKIVSKFLCDLASNNSIEYEFFNPFNKKVYLISNFIRNFQRRILNIYNISNTLNKSRNLINLPKQKK
jgi:hypothetical protein